MADNDSNSFLWFLAGLGVGAVVGVLYAPASGAETRENIRNAASEGRDFVVNRAQQARDAANEFMDRGREMYSQQKDTIRSAFDAGRRAYEQATGTAAGSETEKA